MRINPEGGERERQDDREEHTWRFSKRLPRARSRYSSSQSAPKYSPMATIVK
jgi:hypothetical protein